MAEFPSFEQRQVIDYKGRRLVVVAAPGTGKTRTIVERVIALILEDPARAISLVTFTRTSRRDTDEKLRLAVGVKSADSDDDIDLPRVTTVHTFAKGLVHRYASKLGRDADFSMLVASAGERLLVVREAMEDAAVDYDALKIEKALVHQRSTGRWPGEPVLEDDVRGRLLQSFDLLLRFYGTFDMEGIVMAASEIMAQMGDDAPPVWLQVDEYQDLNPVDQGLVRLASANPASHVVVVGDDAQSIYGFRNANPSGIVELWNSEEWDCISFPQSHRLPAHVLRAAHSLLRNRGYLGTRIEVPKDDGRRILTLQCTSYGLQASAIAATLIELMGSRTKSDGSPLTHSDFMILCPINAQVAKMAEDLKQTFGIPTKQPRDRSILEGVWRLLLILRMLGNGDGLAFRQWLDVVAIPAPDIRELRRAAMREGTPLLEYCSRLETPEIRSICAALSRLRDAQLDPDQFGSALREFPGVEEDDEAFWKAATDLLQYLPFISTMIAHIYQDHGVLDMETPDTGDEDAVLVTTLHSAKGLEREFVFIAWMNAAFMPAAGRDPLEQERVFYVALTRARQDVILTCYEEWDPIRRRRLKREVVSPFLLSIQQHLNLKGVRAK